MNDKLLRAHGSHLLIKWVFHQIIDACVSQILIPLLICGNHGLELLPNQGSRSRLKGENSRLAAFFPESKQLLQKLFVASVKSVKFSKGNGCRLFNLKFPGSSDVFHG